MESFIKLASDPVHHLMQQFLAWIDITPRSYGETMDAWRSSCPRLTAWEDALEAGLVQVDGDGNQGYQQARVSLTKAGKVRLAASSGMAE